VRDLRKTLEFLRIVEARVNSVTQAVDIVTKKGYLFDVGQIDQTIIKKLGQLVDEGDVNKDKVKYPGVYMGDREVDVYYKKEWSIDDLARKVSIV